MSKFRLEYLFALYLQGKITPDEHRELMELIADAGNENQVMDIIEDVANKMFHEKEISGYSSYKILNNILQKKPAAQVNIGRKPLRRWFSIAAAFAVIMSIAGIWFKTTVVKKNKTAVNSQQIVLIHPGGNKASLTLDDGSVVKLDEVSDGVVKNNNHILVQKENGVLIYKNITATQKGSAYHKLTTPRGGQFQVLLPDGSTVWLNAASSIRFSTAPINRERIVELTGEAFFKVKKLYAKDKKTRIPFTVHVKSSEGEDATVRVLGTAFNVNAYEAEDMFKVTLKHGSVKIEKGNKSQLLEPGEQAVVYNDNHISMIKNADVEQAIAWKEGIFLFENEDIKSIMKEISRWYDVDVVYKGIYPATKFDGKISRYADISEVLEILKLSGVEFTVKGKTIHVQ